MTSALRRAGGFAAVATLALAAPELGQAAALPFALVAVLAAFVVDEGPVFELFARVGDYRDGRLNGLAGFALAAAALALLATLPGTTLPLSVYAGSVFVLAYGNLGAKLVGTSSTNPFRVAAGFSVGAFVAGIVAQVAVVASTDGSLLLPRFAFLAASGALVGALLRSVLYERDDPLVMLSVGLLLWLFETIAAPVSATEVAVALVVTTVLGYVSYALGTASVPGMLTGVLLGLLTIVFGGYGWFAVLISFFAIGGLSAKFRYGEKRRRGVAEENEGARGSGNVLGNAAVSLAAVLGFAAVAHLPVGGDVFRVAFAGSIAAAMSDTLSSELGGLFDTPRLITTLEPVDPGTDGGITWQGELAGIAGALVVAAVSVVVFPFLDPTVAGIAVAVGGFVGMTVDSLLGATLEGRWIGNQTVNFAATLAGAVVSVALTVGLS